VILWWGLFDNALYVEHGERRFGPYEPVGGPIPLHRYRSFKKTKTQQRAERIAALAERLALPGSVWGAADASAAAVAGPALAGTPFADPDPFQEIVFPTAVAAKRAIAEYLGTPLAKLPAEALAALDAALAESLRKVDVIDYARTHLKPLRGG
jgi:hypothetical protein